MSEGAEEGEREKAKSTGRGSWRGECGKGLLSVVGCKRVNRERRDAVRVKFCEVLYPMKVTINISKPRPHFDFFGISYRSYTF